MQIKEVLDKTIKFFKDKGFESPRLHAELLLAHSLKIERIQLYLKFEQILNEKELAEARELGVDVSQAAEAGIAAAVSLRRQERWLAGSQAALESSNAFVERHGLPLSRHRTT